MGKRIRYPKKRKQEEIKLEEKKEEEKLEQKQEQPMHFVLDVHDSNATSLADFGRG